MFGGVFCVGFVSINGTTNSSLGSVDQRTWSTVFCPERRCGAKSCLTGAEWRSLEGAPLDTQMTNNHGSFPTPKQDNVAQKIRLLAYTRCRDRCRMLLSANAAYAPACASTLVSIETGGARVGAAAGFPGPFGDQSPKVRREFSPARRTPVRWRSALECLCGEHSGLPSSPSCGPAGRAACAMKSRTPRRAS